MPPDKNGPRKPDVVLIGAGPAGLSAGMYLARAGRQALVLDKGLPGGQARRISWIDNYPGFPSGISGPALMARFLRQGRRWGLRFAREEARSLNHRNGRFEIGASSGDILCRALILCPGSAFRSLGLPGEKRLGGIHHAAFEEAGACRGRDVAVAGGGEAAAHQALHLARYARRVTLICRGKRLKAIGLLERTLAKHPRIRPLYRSAVTGLHGRGRLDSLSVKSLDGGRTRRLKTSALFILVGKEPDLRLMPWKKPPPGFFLAGDIRQGDRRQVAVAAGDGVAAAMACERYLRGDR